MDSHRNTPQAATPRLLVAFDATASPHELVRLCCMRADSDALTVALLAATDGTSPESATAAEHLLRDTVALLDAAGVDLEAVSIAGERGRGVVELVQAGAFDAAVLCFAQGSRAPVRSLVTRQARRRGVPVFEAGHRVSLADQPSWMRRVADPFHLWHRMWDRVG